jgi:hypothetical protein
LTFESGSKLHRIEKGAFSACSSLQSITIPGSVQIVEQFCFSDCASLSSISFDPGSRLQRIEVEAFSNCTSLQSVFIPAALEGFSNHVSAVVILLSVVLRDALHSWHANVVLNSNKSR